MFTFSFEPVLSSKPDKQSFRSGHEDSMPTFGPESNESKEIRFIRTTQVDISTASSLPAKTNSAGRNTAWSYSSSQHSDYKAG
jgi:hypothetical protein